MKNVRTCTRKLTWCKSDVHLAVLDNRGDHVVVASKKELGTLGVLLHERVLALDNLGNHSVMATFTHRMTVACCHLGSGACPEALAWTA